MHAHPVTSVSQLSVIVKKLASLSLVKFLSAPNSPVSKIVAESLIVGSIGVIHLAMQARVSLVKSQLFRTVSVRN